MLAALRLLVLACAVSAATALTLPTPSAADHGRGDEVRVQGSCTGSADSELRVRAEDGRLRIEFRVRSDRPSRAWTVVVLRERRIVFRGPLRAGGGGRELELRRTISDWPGTNTIVVRASSRTGQSCRATATT